jgi:hypothetical protein
MGMTRSNSEPWRNEQSCSDFARTGDLLDKDRNERPRARSRRAATRPARRGDISCRSHGCRSTCCARPSVCCIDGAVASAAEKRRPLVSPVFTSLDHLARRMLSDLRTRLSELEKKFNTDKAPQLLLSGPECSPPSPSPVRAARSDP